jgi:hypothetical protein
MLFREITAVYSENHTKHINTLCRPNEKLLDVEAGDTYNYHCVGPSQDLSSYVTKQSGRYSRSS